MRFLFWWGIFIFGVLVVLYFSWINSPRLELNQFVPKRIAVWADKHENDNIRTAVPLVCLGGLAGLYLITYRKRNAKSWLIIWGGLVGLVAIAELGQLALPLRSADWKDVFWGAVGAALGLIMIEVLRRMRIAYKKLKNGS
ncbi:VanZ family protein [Neotamlana laminarinivorans]|uniref:VanZ family protein n=1 Tax=Neotamlana laminarinivorans TaxID=2883124 RepID=A0A9X1I129_9FLAO|nr:VanZ family protein [Tamlana laminarinivorans]MCB4799010.1 VanZ family protein [Tamlana laminarinivorans]